MAPRLGAEESGRFYEVGAEWGIDFVHEHGGTGEKYMPENMGSGVAVLDFDGDGLLDLYFVQGRPWVERGAELRVSAVNRLFRQRDDGRFEDVTSRSGAGDGGYGMGVSFGDVDRDGDLDLYVTNYGANTLLRNEGDGRFAKVSPEIGVDDTLWSTGAGFFDPDGDGDLDLYVTNYLDFGFDRHVWCGNAQQQVRSYCHPDSYNAVPDRFYRNTGEGQFENATESVGIEFNDQAKGLGLALADLDGDGHEDVYVANDSTRNFLYLGDGAGNFREEGLFAGVAVNVEGRPEAGMGVALGDFDGDLRPDLFVTHLDFETNTLYQNRGGGVFADTTGSSGLGPSSLPWVGFGAVSFDAEGDGDLDLFVANGHIIDNIAHFDASRSHRQSPQLFRNDGRGKFTEWSEALSIVEQLVGRGAIAADLDADGDRDLVVTQNGGRALVLRNDVPQQNPSLTVRLRGRCSNPQGFGAMVRQEAEHSPALRHVPSASSYLSQGPPEVVFAGRPLDAPVAIEWPTGQRQRFTELVNGRTYTIPEPAACRDD